MLSTSLTYGEDRDQVYERFDLPKAAKPTLVVIHGGYWRAQHDREHMRPLAQKLVEQGWPMILVEYRRAPHPPEATIQDINALLASLAPEPLVLIGFSVGGQLAFLTASQHAHVSQVVALAPVTDLVATEKDGLGENAVANWLHESAELHPELDPSRSTPIDIPIEIFHGTEDIRVPIAHSERFVKLRTELGEEISLREVPGAGHFDLIDPNHEYFSQLLNCLGR